MKQTGNKEIRYILEQNPLPAIRQENVDALKRAIQLQADSLPCPLPPDIPFPDRLLRQIPYISLWIWPVQLLVLLLFFVFLREESECMEILIMLSFTGPLLAILPMADIVRSFGCNMWEMESACRYDLRQITAMRLCITGGTDILVLAAGGCLWGRRLDGIPEFGLYVLLPFLISSCIYLWELNHFSGRCSGYMLTATGVILSIVCCFALQEIYAGIQAGGMRWIPVFIPGAVVVSGAAALCGAVSLCGNLKKKEGAEKWNLE